MMSSTVVSAGAASSGYYKSEGYYVAGSEEADAAASWFGKAAESLGLQGRVDDALFTQMLDGQTFTPGSSGPQPDRLVGKIVDGERVHRPGLDLTFSAPKSVSVAALVFDDKRLIEAHDKAVHVAMEYVEKSLVQTRYYKNGSLEIETGGKIIAGLFRHDTSRALDPQLHTHAVIANMVQNSTGKFTALHNGLIFKTQKLGSEIYRNELARGAMEAGYTVERVGKDRLIELKEVPTALVTGFSKRRAEIEKALDERGMSNSAKSAELAALATRTAKHGNLDRNELQANWLKEAKEFGIDKVRIQEIRQNTAHRAATRVPGVTRAGSPPAPHMEDARQSLSKAIAHVSELNANYAEKDLLTAALGFAQKAGLNAIALSIEEAKHGGSLIAVKDKAGNTQLLTDKQTLAQERETTRSFRMAARAPRVKLTNYAKENGRIDRHPDTALSKRLERTTLSEGQKDAVKTSLTGRGQIVGVQGYAGTGKTFMLAHLAKEAGRAGYKVEGLAPSNQAVNQLNDALPASETLQARLLRQRSSDKEANPQKTVLVIDEASMVSTKQMAALLLQANDQKIARVVLVGDVQQLDAVSAGTPFALLQKLGMRTAVMDDIQRQRDDNTLAVVKHAIAGDVQKAFERIGNGIIKAEDVAAQAARVYLSTPPDARGSIGLVTPTNRVREAINTHVRAGLREEGTLIGDEHQIKTLSPLRLSRVEAADPRSYKVGDVVVPHQSVASTGLVKGKMYDVIEVHPRDQKVILMDRDSKSPLSFSPTQNSKASAAVDAYEEKTRNIAIGDDVKFRITDKTQNVENGRAAKITSIDSDAIYLKDADGGQIEITKGSLAAAGLDHAYALTTHDFQGATVDRIVVAMTANEQLANQKSFYVSVSRARDNVTLITDEPARLAERLEAQTGEKISALEAYVEAERERRHEKIEAAKEGQKAEPEPNAKAADELTLGQKEKLPEQASLAGLLKELQDSLQKQRGDYER